MACYGIKNTTLRSQNFPSVMGLLSSSNKDIWEPTLIQAEGIRSPKTYD